MSLIDFILNVAGLLLWFNWRAVRFDPLTKTTPAIPAGTLRRSKPSHAVRWLSWVALLVLICGRALLYRLLGPAVDWTASLDLGAITLFFRTDQFWLMLFFSSLSFMRTLVLAYFWLLTISIIQRNSPASDSISRLIRLQVSRVAVWPVCLQLLLPVIVVMAVWPGLHALLSYSKIAGPLPSFGPLLLQGCLIGLGICFSLKYLIPALLMADLIARYIYFGSSPFWDFLNTTARNLLAPLRRLPLQVGKVDLAPLVGILLTLLLLHALPRLVLRELTRRNLSIWPQ